MIKYSYIVKCLGTKYKNRGLKVSFKFFLRNYKIKYDGKRRRKERLTVTGQ